MSKAQEPHNEYDEEFGIQTVIRESNREDLPKIELPEGEGLYLSYGEITELYERYFELVGSLKEGGAHAPAELRSLMESVVSLSFLDEVTDLRLRNKLKYEDERRLLGDVNEILTPRTRRGWFFRKKRNEAQVLHDELTAREVWLRLQKKQNELPNCGEAQETEIAPYTLQIEALRQLLPRRMRKKRRALWEAVIEGLTVNYEGKAEEQRESAEKLELAQVKLERAEEKISELQKLIEELMSEKQSAEKDPEGVESEETTATVETDTVEVEQSGDPNEDDGLYYGELDESEE